MRVSSKRHTAYEVLLIAPTSSFTASFPARRAFIGYLLFPKHALTSLPCACRVLSCSLAWLRPSFSTPSSRGSDAPLCSQSTCSHHYQSKVTPSTEFPPPTGWRHAPTQTHKCEPTRASTVHGHSNSSTYFF